MPYTGPGDEKLPDNVKKLTEPKRAQWVGIFNSAFDKCQAQENAGDDCEGVAFRTANGVLFKEMQLFTPPVDTGLSGIFSATDLRTLSELDGGEGKAARWARRILDKLDEATMSENEMYVPMGPTTFADMRAAEQADEAAETVHKLAYQFQSLVANIMASESAANKVSAIEALSSEFVDLVRAALGGEMGNAESEPMAELTEAELTEAEFAESAIGHVTRLIEAGDVSSGGSKPVLLEIVPIRPGWGNTRDNNYYPQDVLKRDFALAFDGVKMYETNHIDAETNNKNWVSTYIETRSFDDGAPVGVAGIHDPHFAQKVLNLYELEQSTGKPLLSKLECSIRGNGKKKSGFELDGRKGKQIRELSEGLSIDWVSRAGAGGHARQLTESEEKMPEKEVQETELEEVVIEEEEAQAEPEPVATLEAEAVTAKLAESKLPVAFKAALAQATYRDEAALTEAIAQAVKEVKAISGSGQPFAQGASEPVGATPLSEAEIQEKRTARFNEIMQEVGLKGV